MSPSIANALSVARVPISIAVLAIYSPDDSLRFLVAIGLIATAVGTDLLDGFLARKFRTTSDLGYILDGLGDRAMYVSLILVLVVSKSVSLSVAWVLIFREILIYALRVLSPAWHKSKQLLRPFSKWHAAGIRLWLASYIASDGLRLYNQKDLRLEAWYGILQGFLLTATVVISYSGLYLQAKEIANAVSGDSRKDASGLGE